MNGSNFVQGTCTRYEGADGHSCYWDKGWKCRWDETRQSSLLGLLGMGDRYLEISTKLPIRLWKCRTWKRPLESGGAPACGRLMAEKLCADLTRRGSLAGPARTAGLITASVGPSLRPGNLPKRGSDRRLPRFASPMP